MKVRRGQLIDNQSRFGSIMLIYLLNYVMAVKVKTLRSFNSKHIRVLTSSILF